MKHIFLEHLKNCKKHLEAYSSTISIADHKVNLGSAREALVNDFLVKNLPDAISYGTGELFDFKGDKSGQADLVLLPSTAPKLNLFSDFNLYPCDCVLGVIEVKSILNTGNGENGDLAQALKNCYKLKSLEKLNSGEIKLNKDILDLRFVPYIIFAFRGSSKQSVFSNIDRHIKSHNKNYLHLPDIIVNLEKGYYLIKDKNSTYFSSTTKAEELYSVYDSSSDYVLKGLFDYVLSASEHLSISPEDFKMPFKEYTEKSSSLYDSDIFSY